MKDSSLHKGALLAITLMAVVALGFNVSAVRYESVESYETLLENQADLVQGFEKLLKGIPADQELAEQEYLSFLNSFKDLKDRQLDQTERFVTLVEQSYETINDVQRAELALSEKNLMTQQEMIQGSYEGVLKYGFRYIGDIRDKGRYVDDFEKELHREQALLSRFESLLNKEEFQEPGDAGTELPERGIFKKLLGLFEEDIRLMDGLIRSFNMLQNMENGEVPAYLTIKKELVQDTTGYRYKYTVTNALGGVDLKDVEVTDSSLGLIKNQTGEEKFSLSVGATVDLFSDYQQFECITCQGCVCRWCNFAIAMGYQVADDKVVYNLSNYVCYSSSGGGTVPQTLHGELEQALPCCEYLLLPDTGGKVWLIVEDPNSTVKAKLDQILSYCKKVGNTPLIEVTGTYYESYESPCWTGPVMIVEDVHYAVEVVKSADPIVVKVGDKVNFKATVHNYWNRSFKDGEVDDFNCSETSPHHHMPIGEIAPESDLPSPVTWAETYAKEGEYCDFVNVKGEVEVPGGTKAVLWDSNKVNVTVMGGLRLEKYVDAPTAFPGQVLVYTYVLTNNFGSVETSVSIVDDLLGQVTSDQTLQPGETKIFKKGYQVPTEGELPDNLTNKATATITIQASSDPKERQTSISGESNTVTVDIIKDCKEADYIPTTAWGMVLKDGDCYYLDVAHDTSDIIRYKLIGDAAEFAKYLTDNPTYPKWVAVSGCLNTKNPPATCNTVDFTGQMNVGYIRKALQVEKIGDKTEGMTGDSVTYTFFVINRWHLPIKFTLYDDPDIGVQQPIQDDQLDPGVVFTYYYPSEIGDMSDGSFCDKPSVTGVEIGSIGNRNFNDAGPLWCILPLGAPTHVQMKFEQDYLDLLTGEIKTGTGTNPPSEPWTLKIVSNAALTPHAEVLQNQDPAANIQIAHLVGKAFNEVTDADVVAAPWTPDLVDEPFDSTRVVLIRQESRIFKLGNPVEHDPDSVEFDYEEMPS